MERNVPKLRFKGFNDELKKEKFQNLVTLQRGSSPRPIIKYITTSEDGVNWIKIGDVSTGKTFIDKTAEKITKEGAEKSRKVQVGDLILSNSMSFGRPYIMKIDGYIHDGWFVLKNYQKNFNREYLCQLLTSPIIQKQYKRLAAGGVVNNISSELVNAVIVNVPSLQEQERIANFLTKVDKIIEKQDEKVKNLEKYKKGMMQKIFSQDIRFKDENGDEYPEWEEAKLSQYINAISSGKTKIKSDEGIYKVYGSTGVIGYSNNFDYFGEYVLIARVGANAGIINRINEKCGISDNTLVIECSDKMNYVFLEYMLRSYNLSKLIFGSGQPLVTGGQIKNIEMNLPILEEQIKIAGFLSSVDNIVKKEEEKLEKLKEWKKGLLQQMFV